MFRASQIFGDRDRPKPPPQPAAQQGPPQPPNPPARNAAAVVDWNNPQARNQLRQEMAGGMLAPVNHLPAATAPMMMRPRQPSRQQPPPAVGAPLRAPPARVRVQPVGISQNTVIVNGPGLAAIGEEALEATCRQIAIDGCFSVHDSIWLSASHTAQLEFPHADAAVRFVEACQGQIQLQGRGFWVKHPFGGQSNPTQSSSEGGGSTSSAAAPTEAAAPTDTLLIRQLGDTSESDLLAAFSAIAPRIKGVRVAKDWKGARKGFGFVTFHEVHEAENAMRNFQSSSGLVAGKRVTATFAPPQSFEEALEREASQKRSEDSMKESHAQALQGPNADMWASYLAMFSAGQDAGEPPTKRPRGSPEGMAEAPAITQAWSTS